jgi:outer membrane protein TolC
VEGLFRWDLLNYGRIINNVQLQAAGLQELVSSYQNTVLTANQEVEDALVVRTRLVSRRLLLRLQASLHYRRMYG